MQQISFALSLKNQLSAPLGAAGRSVSQFAQNSREALASVGMGFAGLWAGFQPLKGLVTQSGVLKNALDELSLRGVSGDVLDALRRKASALSGDFGIAAEDVIGGARLMRREFRGLNDVDLSRAAASAATLGAAVKSGTDNAAQYISDLAGVFTLDVSMTGGADFAESLASKTAWLVKNTGRDMDSIRAVINSAGKTGAGAGIRLDEQLVVSASLSGSLGDSAGGIYDEFLKNARNGARTLGMSFTDAQGRLLAFPDILDKLQARYGDSVAGNVKLQQKLNRAFGSGAAALTASWGSAQKLRRQIHDIQGIRGLGGASDSAAGLADVWSRLARTGERVKAAIGNALSPVIDPLADKVARASSRFAKWLEMFPNIARVVGYVTIGVVALTAAASLMTALAGIRMMLQLTGLIKLFRLLNLALLPTRIGLLALSIQAKALAVRAGVCRVALLAWNGVLAAGAIAMRIYGAATMLAGTAMQLLTSPITLIILAVAALAAGVWYAVTHWDSLKAAVMDSSAFKFIAGVITDLGNTASTIVNKIRGFFIGLFDDVKRSVLESLNWIIEKLNKLPGVEIDLLTTSAPDPQVQAAVPPPAGLSPPVLSNDPAAQLLKGGDVDNSRHVGVVNVYPQNNETFNSLMESRELYAG